MVFRSIKIGVLENLPTRELAFKDDNAYYKYVFRLPIFYMKALGLFHFKSDHFAFKFYRLFTLVCCWFCFAKFLTSFKFFYGVSEAFNKNLVLKLCMAIWLLVNSIHMLLSFCIMEKKSYKNEYLHRLNEILKKDESPEQNLKKLRQKFIVIFLISFILLAANMVSLILSFFGPKDLEDLFGMALSPYQNTTVGDNVYYRLFQTSIFFYPSAVWTTVIFYFIAELLLVQTILNTFNMRFEKFIQTANNETNQVSEDVENNFEILRQEHLKHCELVASLNKCYKHIVSTTVIFYQASNLLLLYVISNWSSFCITGISAFAYPFWLVTNTLIIAVCLYFSSQIIILVT